MGDFPVLEELVRMCAERGSVADWEAFVNATQKMIAIFVTRTANQWGYASPQIVDDLVQETYLKMWADDRQMLRRIKVRHDGSVAGFIKVVTANVVHDHFKAQHAQRRGGGKPAIELKEISTSAIPSEQSVAAIEREILLTELQQVLDACDRGIDRGRNQRIFWLYYRHGLTARAIASLPGISLTVKAVESIILRLTRLMREKIAERASGPRIASEGFRSEKS